MARKFDLVLQSLSVSGTCSFCTFLIIKVFESTLLRLPCAPGKFEMSRHCREDDDDGGGPATKVPRESIDDNPTRRYTRSSLPALDLKKCLLCHSRKETKSCWSHEALTRCTLESSPTILLSTARIWVLGQGSLLPLSQGGAFTLASISYLAILVKYTYRHINIFGSGMGPLKTAKASDLGFGISFRSLLSCRCCPMARYARSLSRYLTYLVSYFTYHTLAFDRVSLGHQRARTHWRSQKSS